MTTITYLSEPETIITVTDKSDPSYIQIRIYIGIPAEEAIDRTVKSTFVSEQFKDRLIVRTYERVLNYQLLENGELKINQP